MPEPTPRPTAASNEPAVKTRRPLGDRGGSFGKRVRDRGASWGRALVRRPARTAPVLVALVIGVSAAVVGLSGLEALEEQDRRREELLSEVEGLRQQAQALRDSITALREDPAAFELLARTHHHLVEPGEIVVLLDLPVELSVETDAGAPEAEPGDSR